MHNLALTRRRPLQYTSDVTLGALLSCSMPEWLQMRSNRWCAGCQLGSCILLLHAAPFMFVEHFLSAACEPQRKCLASEELNLLEEEQEYNGC